MFLSHEQTSSKKVMATDDQNLLTLNMKVEASFTSAMEDLHMEVDCIHDTSMVGGQGPEQNTPPMAAGLHNIAKRDTDSDHDDSEQSSASEETVMDDDEASGEKVTETRKNKNTASKRNLKILLTTPPQLPDKRKDVCKKAKKSLTLGERMTVIRLSDEGKSTRQIAKLLGVGRTQIQRTVKRKQEYICNFNQNAPLDQRRQLRKNGNESINELCWKWYQEMSRRNIKINGPMLKERALNFAAESGNNKFKASNGWLDSFLRRHNVAFGKVDNRGESKGVDHTIVADWKMKLKSLCEGYEEKDIYNLDETGMFFKITCDKSFYIKGQQCLRGSQAADRLTVMLCSNMIGEKETAVVAGNLSLSRHLTGVNIQLLPVSFKLSYKSWMNSEIFISWITAFNNKMALEQRHIILFLDNALCHQYLQLSNIKLQYLPPNISPLLQPLHQGIIQEFKRSFRRKQMSFITGEMEAHPQVTALELMKKSDIVDCLYWIASAWNEIPQSTIKKCFLLCGFEKSSDNSRPFISTRKNDIVNPPEFDRICAELIGRTFSEMCVVDEELAVCNMNPDNFIHNPTEPDLDSQDEVVDVNRKPTFAEANEALKTLCKYVQSQGMHQTVNEVFSIHDSLVLAKCNQREKTIDEFLKSYIMSDKVTSDFVCS